jgi:hypothetical protein
VVQLQDEKFVMVKLWNEHLCPNYKMNKCVQMHEGVHYVPTCVYLQGRDHGAVHT